MEKLEPLLAHSRHAQVMKPRHLAPLLSSPPPTIPDDRAGYYIIAKRSRSYSRKAGPRRMAPGAKLEPLPAMAPPLVGELPPEAEPVPLLPPSPPDAMSAAPGTEPSVEPAAAVVSPYAKPRGSGAGDLVPKPPAEAFPGQRRSPQRPQPQLQPQSPQQPPQPQQVLQQLADISGGLRSPGGYVSPPLAKCATKLAKNVYGAPVVPGIARTGPRARRRPVPPPAAQVDGGSSADKVEPPVAAAVAKPDAVAKKPQDAVQNESPAEKVTEQMQPEVVEQEVVNSPVLELPEPLDDHPTNVEQKEDDQDKQTEEEKVTEVQEEEANPELEEEEANPELEIPEPESAVQEDPDVALDCFVGGLVGSALDDEVDDWVLDMGFADDVELMDSDGSIDD